MLKPRLHIPLFAGLVVLLAMPNVLLWRLLDETTELQRPAAEQVEAAPLPPPLAESKRGTTTRALARELDRTTRTLSRPLDAVRSNLAELPPGVRGLLDNTSGLSGDIGSLVDQTRGLGALSTSLDVLVDNTQGLSGLRREVIAMKRGLLAVLKETRQLRGVRKTLDRLNGRLDSFGGTLTATNRSLGDINTTLQETNRSLERLHGCLQRPVLCD